METLTRNNSHTLPEREEPLRVTPELQAMIEQAERDSREGRCVTCHTKEELAAFFHRL